MILAIIKIFWTGLMLILWVINIFVLVLFHNTRKESTTKDYIKGFMWLWDMDSFLYTRGDV